MKLFNQLAAVFGSVLVIGAQIIFKEFSWNRELACVFLGMQAMGLINSIIFWIDGGF